VKVKNIRIGSLNRRFRLEERRLTDAGGGGFTQDWNELSTIWGSFTPISARERWNAHKLEPNVTHRIITRYRPDIRVNEDQHLALDTLPERQFNIRGVVNIEEQDRFMELLVEEGVAQ